MAKIKNKKSLFEVVAEAAYLSDCEHLVISYDDDDGDCVGFELREGILHIFKAFDGNDVVRNILLMNDSFDKLREAFKALEEKINVKKKEGD